MSDRSAVGSLPAAQNSEPRIQPAVQSLEDFRIRPHHCFACGELNDIGLHLILRLETGAELAVAEATYVAAPAARKAELKERYGFGTANPTNAFESARADGPTPAPLRDGR